MPKYYCPYCSPRYQISIECSDCKLTCGKCGDPLVRVSVIKSTQIFALISASAFIAPLIITTLVFIQDLKRPQSIRPNQVMSILLTESF